jgi:hypothetical protein
LLDADPKVTIAYCRSRRVLDDGRVDGFADPLLPGDELRRWSADFSSEGVDECRGCFTLANLVRNASSAVFRKDAYQRIGGADETLRLCGDWKLWAGLALCGRMCYVSEPLNYYRLHQGSVWGRSADGTAENQEVLHVVRWVMSQASPSEEMREIVCRRLSLGWVMALMSLHVPLERKRAILQDVRAIDPHPMRRVLRPVLTTFRMAAHRRWRDLRAMLIPTRTAP